MKTFALVGRWLVLVLSGWLLYGFAGALAIVIRLGAPFYDWQWYLGIVVLLVGAAVCVAWRVPRRRVTLPFSAVVLAWLVIGFGGFRHTETLRLANTQSVPISFWASTKIGEASESVLEDVRSAGGKLYITVDERALEGDARRKTAERLRRLGEHDFEVYLAAHVSDYLSVPVYDEWEALVRKTAAFVEQEELVNVRGIIGDAECPMHSRMDVFGSQRDEYSDVVHKMARLIETMRGEYRGLTFGVTANWHQYTDGADGDDDLQIVERSPVDPRGGWEYMSVMVYSSYLPSFGRAYYVYLIGRAMARRYPDRPLRCLIGVVGFPQTPLLGYEELVRDARLSRTLGVDEIVVFILDGALQDFGQDFVRRFVSDVDRTELGLTVQVPFSRVASMFFYGVALGDALLDVFRRRIWVLICWIALSGILVYSFQKGRNSREGL